jgi:predicted PurR-regulated permease PerM
MSEKTDSTLQIVKQDENGAVTQIRTTADVLQSGRAIVRIVLLTIVVLFFVALSGALVYWLSGLILLIVLAIFFAYLIAPLVDLIQVPFARGGRTHWMPRPLAIAIVYAGLIAGAWAGVNYLFPIVSDQISDLAAKFPTYTTQVRSRFEEYERRFKRLPMPPEFRKQIEESVAKTGSYVTEFTTSSLGYLALELPTIVSGIVLIPILGFFFLKDAELFKLAAVRAFPRGQLRGRAELFLQDLNKTLAAYTRAQLISCAFIGTVCTIAFYLLGVPYALLLGIIAAVLEFIPLVGPLTVGILATLVASFYSTTTAVTTASFLLILRLIHDYVTFPRIVREGIHLHPLAIILAVLAGGEIAGVTGIFLSIPIVAAVTVTYRHLMEHSGSAGLVAELLDEGKTDQAIDVAEKQMEQIHEQAVKGEGVSG